MIQLFAQKTMPGKLHYTAIREWPRVNVRSEAYNPSAVKEHFKVTYFEIIDAVHDGLKERFDQILYLFL